ncbi:hypothetical protein EV701_1196 [Chthoniobacter flavus]|nr:hypothetical protein EV701_1196 [Chthoniobacter flavus]
MAVNWKRSFQLAVGVPKDRRNFPRFVDGQIESAPKTEQDCRTTPSLEGASVAICCMRLILSATNYD